eukprot:scaffold2456_cov238-Pinguiococcus_pyrenoidosus.AAC.4
MGNRLPKGKSPHLLYLEMISRIKTLLSEAQQSSGGFLVADVAFSAGARVSRVQLRALCCPAWRNRDLATAPARELELLDRRLRARHVGGLESVGHVSRRRLHRLRVGANLAFAILPRPQACGPFC